MFGVISYERLNKPVVSSVGQNCDKGLDVSESSLGKHEERLF